MLCNAYIKDEQAERLLAAACGGRLHAEAVTWPKAQYFANNHVKHDTFCGIL